MLLLQCVNDVIGAVTIEVASDTSEPYAVRQLYASFSKIW